MASKGMRLGDIPTIKDNGIEHLLGLSRDALENYNKQWHERRAKCVASEGTYLDED